MSFYKHGEGNLIFVTGGAVKDFPAFLQKQKNIKARPMIKSASLWFVLRSVSFSFTDVSEPSHIIFCEKRKNHSFKSSVQEIRFCVKMIYVETKRHFSSAYFSKVGFGEIR